MGVYALSLLVLAGCDPSGVKVGGTDKGTTDLGRTDSRRTPEYWPPENPEDVDNDGDGYTEIDGDCDDDDATINPEGDEGTEANGVDEDCTGIADDVDACEFEVPLDLQAAIDGTPEDFTLRLCPGLWRGAFTIPHPMSILGEEGPAVTTLRGDGTAAVLTIGRVGGTVGVEGLTIDSGVAENGGGIVANRVELRLVGNVVTGNVATAMGGGIYLQDCSGELTNNQIQDNEAASGGGVTVWEGAVTLEGNTISGNRTTSVDEEIYGKGAGGGGVFIYGNSDLYANTIEENESAYNAGGLYLYGGNGTVDGNTIQRNHGVNDGGGILLNYGSQTFTNNLVLENVCDDDGGGLRVYVGQGAVVTDNTFIGNTTVDDGGGMKLSHSRNTIARNYFESNVAGDAGGGLELDNETSHVVDCEFVGNQASMGGGLHTWQVEAPIELERLTFTNNVATTCGGAIGVDNDPLGVTFRHVWAHGNWGYDGGAICIDKRYQDDELTIFEDSAVTFENSVFWLNVADDDAGILYSLNGHTTFRNVTAYDNSGSDYGGFSLEDSSLEVVNSILADQDGSVFLGIKEGVIVSTAAFSYSLFFDNDGGFVGIDDPVGASGNIGDDHLMTDPESGDFTLSAGSPATDAGDPGVQDADGSAADMGAYGGPAGSW